MSAIITRLDRFWFAEAPAERLAILRIVIGLYAVWLLQFRYGAILGVMSLPTNQFQPVGVMSFLGAPLPAQVVHAGLLLAVVCSVLFVLGLAYRVTGPLFAGTLLAVLTYYASWGSVNHPDALLVVHIAVLGLTRAADALSVDAVIHSRRSTGGWRSAIAPPTPSGAWQYGFAVKLVCAVTVASYLLAGIAKVNGPNGWAWGTGELLLQQVAFDALRKELLGQPPPAYASFLYEQVWLFSLLAIGSLVVELGAPLALLDRRIGYAWALAAFPMHWGIYFVMGISFKYYLWGLAYVAFFPLDRLASSALQTLDGVVDRVNARLAGSPASSRSGT